ncbi:NHLP bacteriocin system secretion protein [Magnetovibrio sp. PR-2]|uniref:NHLP bacteriocin system secretion protein n=1 Tax=Magnetovibrio sp. PR-2 TaxID=3120356 RepID=UPI002FCDE7ED
MGKQIFRQAAVDRLSTPENLDQAIRVTSPMGWFAAVVFVCFVISGVVWGIVGSVPIKVAGQGILISPSGVLDIVSASQGRIRTFQARPGEQVTAGDVVAHIEQPDLEHQLNSKKAELSELVLQLEQVQAFHQREMDIQLSVLQQRRINVQQSIGFLSDRLKWLEERARNEGKLQKKGYIQTQKVIDTKIEINTAREDLSKSQNALKEIDLEESTLAIAKEREILDLRLKSLVLGREVESLEGQYERNTRLRSPYTGRIVELKLNPGEIVDTGVSVFSLLPTQPRSANVATGSAQNEANNLIAVLYVAPTDGKKIKTGMDVHISPSTVKQEEYGFILGQVRSVAEIPSTSQGMTRILKNEKLVETLSGGGAPFEITVELHRNPDTPSGFKWSSSQGPNVQMNPGTLADAKVTVRRVRLISVVIPALEQLLGPIS